ncbi:MAG: response regulator transcription factor [Breznakibacter sp.]|nr:response regulator transcription factor [Breznakibacter sp.]
MSNKRRLLLVEDDSSMGFLLVDFLENCGFDISLAVDGQKGLDLFRSVNFDLCILDVMLPGIDGFALASAIRRIDPAIPFIFLSARSMKPDKMKGFALGADDYVTKPFDEEELLCRIQAILNRTQISVVEPQSQVAKFGNYAFNWDNQVLLYQGAQERRLTKKESDVLKMLCLNRNKLLKREDILIALWGENDYFHGRSLDVFIARLRKYLKKDDSIGIENVPGVGFIFNVQ